jgi:hypothetical protein
MYVPLVKVVTSEPLAAVQLCVVVSSLLSVQLDGFTRDFLISVVAVVHHISSLLSI